MSELFFGWQPYTKLTNLGKPGQTWPNQDAIILIAGAPNFNIEFYDCH